MSQDQKPAAPTLRQQLGFEQDPNRLEHSISHNGAPVTKLESSQPGFPVYHRRIAKWVSGEASGLGERAGKAGRQLVTLRWLSKFD